LYIPLPKKLGPYLTSSNKCKLNKQQRERMKNTSHYGEGTNRKGRVKEGSKEGEYG
jgi:hypothetical protein